MSVAALVLKILTIIGSIGLFLYGMKLMSESLQRFAGARMRNILTAITSNRFRGLFTGLFVTGLIQSSSASTVLLVSFVNAGLISLNESISVIMGTNIGTTITPWIISIIGLGKTFNISIILLPLVAVILPFFFSNKSKYKSFSEFIIGFVILFLGLFFIKEYVPEVDQSTYFFEHFSLASDFSLGNVLLFVIIGIIITILFQSSSATIALTFIIATKGWISFPLALAMVLGENIGTTSTAIFASFVANNTAKRSAFSHLIINVIAVVWGLLLFKPIIWLLDITVIDVNNVSPLNDAAAIPLGICVFHSSLNIINTAILVNFIPFIASLTKKIIPGEDDDTKAFKLKYINNTILSTSELAHVQANKEVIFLAGEVRDMLTYLPDLLLEKRPKKYKKILKKIYKVEKIVDLTESEIAQYLIKISDGKLSDKSSRELRAMLRIIDELESVADLCVELAQTIDRKNEENAWFTQELRNSIYDIYNRVVINYDRMVDNLMQSTEDSLDKARQNEQLLDEIYLKLKDQHIKNIDNNYYPYRTGVYYSEMLTLFEKMGDYIYNISNAIREIHTKQENMS